MNIIIKYNISYHIDNDCAHLPVKLNIDIIIAVEHQTMNYYMNAMNLYNDSSAGRRMYQEIAKIEEEHVSQHESFADTRTSWFKNLLLYEYTECDLYYSPDDGTRPVYPPHLGRIPIPGNRSAA